MLHEADPTDLENDPEELLHLEGKKNTSNVYTSHYLKKSTYFTSSKYRVFVKALPSLIFKFNDEIDKKLHQQVQTMKNKTYLQVFFITILKKISFLLVFVESTQQTLPFNLSVALILQISHVMDA